MPETSGPRLGGCLEKLRDLFVDGFQEQSLNELLLFRLDLKLTDEVSAGDSFQTIVFNLIVKALAEGWLLDLATRAAELRQARKPEWTVFVAELGVVLGRVPLPSAALVAVPRRPAPPEELQTVVGWCDKALRRSGPPADLGDSVRRMQTFPLVDYDLTEFVLSDSPGWRLAAILALALRPDVRFLNWLAERVGLEGPAVAYHAGLALKAAAGAVSPRDLEAVSRAIAAAVQYLPATIPTTGCHDTLGRALDLVARTLGVLSEAAARADRRAAGRD